jgi:hypothetical protein
LTFGERDKNRVKVKLKHLIEFLIWWIWKRWRIYCPKRSIAHLFDQNRRLVATPFGIMEFPSPDEFVHALFHYDEAFVFPCSLNESYCGGYRGKWTPKINFIHLESDDRMKDE